MTTICFATNNKGKLQEIKAMLEPSYRVVSLEEIGCIEEIPETSSTIEGNSLQKARYVYEKYKTSCFADDTGLEVEALDGAPGVYSARYAGPACLADDNMALLLKNMQGLTNRNAQFRTCITLVVDGVVHRFDGVIKGSITQERFGEKGFGYDPVFIPEGHQRSFAQMSMEEKNKISHRAKAVEQLIMFLQKR